MRAQDSLRKVLLVVAAAVWLVSAPGCTRKTLPATGGAPGSPGDMISTFTLMGHTEQGRKKWEIQGETADLLAQLVDLAPVRATSFGQTEIHLSAQKGRYDKAARLVHLRGDVVITTSDGAELTSNQLDWMQDREIGTTSDWVRITREGMTATGIGGMARPKGKRVRLEKKVTVVLQGTKGKTVITCDGPLEVDYGRNKARFWRNVLVRDAQGWIRSDRMDVVLDPATNQMVKAIFWGRVRIDHGGETAAANRAEYWQPLHRMHLMGHPKLMMLPEDTGALE